MMFLRCSLPRPRAGVLDALGVLQARESFGPLVVCAFEAFLLPILTW